MAARPTLRHLGWLLATLALVVVGDRALAAGLRAAVLRTENRFAVLYRGELPPGAALVIGNSRGRSTFHTPTLSARLGRPVFDLSENGLSTELLEMLLYDALERNSRPSLVVIEPTSVLTRSHRLHELLPFAARSERLARYADAHLPPARRVARRLFALYSFNGETLVRALAAGSASDQGAANPQRISAAYVATVAASRPFRFAPRPESLAALGRMTDRLEAEGIPYRLVVGPYLPAYRARVLDFEGFLRAVEAAAGAPVLDLSRAVPDAERFADRLHLNLDGARQLAPVLVERGVFEAGAPAGE